MLRFAPSPTRDFLIEDLKIALLNYIVAKRRDKKFLVRIEDTPKEELIEGRDTEIMLILEKFGIVHDFLYHQSQHLNIHQNLAIRLLKEGKAYIPNGSKKLNLKGKDKIKDFTILEENGNPTPIFASACDNILSGIDFIVRGERLKDRSKKERYIQQLLGYGEIEYIHTPPIAKNITVIELFKEGFIPDAIINYILLESYQNPPEEIFYLKDAISWFKVENISKEPKEFNIERLKFLNREHIRLLDEKALSRFFGFADVNIGKLAKLYLGECSTLNELNSKIMPIFKPKNFNNSWGGEMRLLSDIIFNAPPFKKFDEFEGYLIKKSGLSGDNLYKPLRLLLTNSEESPELSKIYPLIKSYILEVAS